MKIYLLVAPHIGKPWNEDILGVFSSLEKAQDALPGMWVERSADYWETALNGIDHASIFEYKVDADEQSK